MQSTELAKYTPSLEMHDKQKLALKCLCKEMCSVALLVCSQLLISILPIAPLIPLTCGITVFWAASLYAASLARVVSIDNIYA